MKIEELRLKEGLSQRQLSLNLNVSENYICLVESGKINPSDKIKKRIAEIFGISVGQLFFEESEKGQK